jgi:hypothetical protein
MAKPTRVALAQVEGDSKEGEVGAAIVNALDGTDLTVVTPKEVTRAIEKLGLSDDLSEKEIKKLEGELEAGAFVQGRLEKEGKSRTLKFKLFIHGKKQKGFSVSFTNVRSDKFKKTIKSTMVKKIGGSDAEEPVASEEEKPAKKKKDKDKDVADEDKPGKKKKDKDVATADDDKSKKKKKKAEEVAADQPADDDKPKKKKKKAEEEVAADQPADDDKPKKKKKSARRDVDDTDDVEVATSVKVTAVAGHAANRDAVRADLGPSFQNRSLKFNSRTFDTGLGPPKAYSNSFVPGARFEGEVYPLAFQSPGSPLAGLGLAAQVDQTVSLTLRTSLQPDAALKATQRNYNIGLRYRYVFGNTPTSASVTVGVGYGRRTFTVDRTPLMDGITLDLPDTDYKYFDPGVDVRVPIAGAVAIFLGGRALAITKAGAITSAAEYGQATVTGFTGDAGLDFVLSNRFAFRVSGEFAQVGLKFRGLGVTKATNRDMDPTTVDIYGATDRSFGGAVTIAVLY